MSIYPLLTRWIFTLNFPDFFFFANFKSVLCTNTEWNKTRNENESKQHSQSITTTKEELLLLEARACTQIQTQKNDFIWWHLSQKYKWALKWLAKKGTTRKRCSSPFCCFFSFSFDKLTHTMRIIYKCTILIQIHLKKG